MAAFNGVNGPLLRVQFWKIVSGTGSWVDVTTTDVLEVKINRGKTRSDGEPVAGVANITLDNVTGIYDPDYTTASTWVISGISIIRDGFSARIIATWNSVDYVLFLGKMETADIDVGYMPTVTINLVDGLAEISAVEMPALSQYLYLNESTATRVGRILDTCGWTNANNRYRSLTGPVLMQSTVEGINALTEIQQCVVAQGGSFYISRTGVATLIPLEDKFSRPTQLCFDDQHYPISSSTTSNSIATGSKTFAVTVTGDYMVGTPVVVVNTGTPANFMKGTISAITPNTSITVNVTSVGGSGTFTAWQIEGYTIEYDAVATAPGSLQVINHAVLTRGKARQVTMDQNISILLYGRKTIHVEAFVQSDKTAMNLAHYYAFKDSVPMTTVTQIGFNALTLGDLYPDFLSCELKDQVTVKRKTVDGRNLVMNLVIEGMNYDITPNDWRSTFYTSPMNPFKITL
jgi:hypothetical protein